MYSKRLFEIHLRIAFKTTTVLHDNNLIRGVFLDKKSHKKGVGQVSSIMIGQIIEGQT